MDFSPQAFIDIQAFRHNLTVVRKYAPRSRVMAVIKADAYGHGAGLAAQSLRQADGFAVARCDEALRLRRLGIKHPILVMGGAYNLASVDSAFEQGFMLAIHHLWQIDLLASVARGRLPRCIIKVDSGMHRLGLLPDEVRLAVERLSALGCLGERRILMTHMACADDVDSPKTRQQWQLFAQLAREFDAEVSAANSAMIMGHADMSCDWVRPGIMLYGASPFIDSSGPEVGLQPVMTLQAPVIAVKSIGQGETVGYGATWTARERMPIGIIGIGYGDGYPRHAPDGTPVLLNGVKVPLVGRVSMDMIAVDLRDCPMTRTGDMATLWGRGLPAEWIATAAGTIAYQLFCNVTGRVRVQVSGEA
jgi:alanine racemase